MLSISVPENQIRAYPSASASTAPTPEARLEIKYVTTPVTLRDTSVNLFGGQSIDNCTTGYSVKQNVTAVPGITDANHCSNDGHWNGYTLPFKLGREGSGHDEQWFGTTTGVIAQPWVYDGGGNRHILSKTPRSSQTTGTYVCKYGKTTGLTCGTIVNNNLCWPDNGCGFVQVTADIDLSQGGDSGGPVFRNNAAYGLVKGEWCFLWLCNDMVYTPEDTVERGLGVTIMLASS